MKNVVTGLLLSMLAGPLMAFEVPREWSGEAELGFVMTSGNTDTQTLNAKGKAVNEQQRWRNSLAAEMLNTEDGDSTTGHRYLLAGKSNYKFRPRRYVLAIVTYEDDRFSGYDWRTTEVLGYGFRPIESGKLILDLDAGPGARQSQLDDGNRVNEKLIRVGGDLDWKVSDNTHFTEELFTELGEQTTITKSVSGLKTQINSTLAMKVSYSIKRFSDVPLGRDRLDRVTGMTLVYGF